MLVSKEYTQTATAVLSDVLLDKERKPRGIKKVESILSKQFNGNAVRCKKPGFYIVHSATLFDAHKVIQQANLLGFKNTEIRNITPDIGLGKQSYHVHVGYHVKTFGNQLSKSIYDLVGFIIDIVDDYVVEIYGQGAELKIKVNDVNVAALLSTSIDRYLVTINQLYSESYRVDVQPSGVNNFIVTLSFL